MFKSGHERNSKFAKVIKNQVLVFVTLEYIQWLLLILPQMRNPGPDTAKPKLN